MSGGERTSFYRSLSVRSRLSLILFIFFTFAPISVLLLSRFAERRSWLSLAAFAGMSGFTAVGWALAFMRSMRVLWILVPAQVLWFVIPVYFRSDFRSGLTLSLEGSLCAALIVVGYVLFVRFVRGEGAKSIRMETELALAGQIHESLLPPINVRHGQLEVFGRSIASSEMGGDLMDIVVEGSSVSVYIADVSGHGVKAGVVMAMTKTALRTRLQQAQRQEDPFNAVNRVLCELSTAEMFVTGACLCFDGVTRADRPPTVSFSGAGHGDILHYRRDRGGVERLSSGQLPLGISPGETYIAREVDARAGDVFLLMTDGLPETFDVQGRILGEAVIESTFLRCAGAALVEIHDAVMGVVKAHGTQVDDQTLVLVRVG